MSSKPVTKEKGIVTINLSDIADRYLEVYQRLFDLAGFLGTAATELKEPPFESFVKTCPVVPKAEARMDFTSTRQAATHWLARSILSEALSTVAPLLEDCRTVLALCDYKAAGKTDEDKVKRITGRDRKDFMALEIPGKLDYLKDKYRVHPELRPHLTALSGITRDLIMADGRATRDHTLKIRALCLSPDHRYSMPSAQPAGKVPDQERRISSGDRIELSREELTGSMVTIAGFMATLMDEVQRYALKVGAASETEDPEP